MYWLLSLRDELLGKSSASVHVRVNLILAIASRTFEVT